MRRRAFLRTAGSVGLGGLTGIVGACGDRTISALNLAGVRTCEPTNAAATPVTFDESQVPSFTLPDPLQLENGDAVRSAATWRKLRRPEILELFESQVYGRSPRRAIPTRFDVTSRQSGVLGGVADRIEVRATFGSGPNAPAMETLIHLPAGARGPVPIFTALNFAGNHSVHPDPAITPSSQWIRSNPDAEVERGARIRRWPIEQIVERGYGIATTYSGDLDPDFDDGFQNGIHPLFRNGNGTDRGPDEWGSIGAWAWGLSRTLDYFETDDRIDHTRSIVVGHSRLGKTALWAGAQDERFAIVISNDSGCSGAAISRRRFGETVAIIQDIFPHWFCPNYRCYRDAEDTLPVDQHMLLALVAPRPVYVASASEDLWADPRGEFLGALGADPVYRLHGTDGLAAREMPGVEQPILSTIGHHIRPGVHDLLEYDWQRFMDFADRHL